MGKIINKKRANKQKGPSTEPCGTPSEIEVNHKIMLKECECIIDRFVRINKCQLFGVKCLL